MNFDLTTKLCYCAQCVLGLVGVCIFDLQKQLVLLVFAGDDEAGTTGSRQRVSSSPAKTNRTNCF